ncbi:hypothetical protein PUR71_38415 [Streptomyces sp. SP17BM10]|uniref:hypothetical protein n=1 Tax=Streptomyces sp. SP17BM10 TaxID=3002530 RepID=UPI002E789B25|nr:hypothetical protein [Streptomyces sp. SP17BM10]MEE1788735.1 hypothetical protein [Streptomyces sp. SP17BM10]
MTRTRAVEDAGHDTLLTQSRFAHRAADLITGFLTAVAEARPAESARPAGPTGPAGQEAAK